MALPVSPGGTDPMINPGMAANVEPSPRPSTPIITQACQSDWWNTAKKALEKATTRQPTARIVRRLTRCVSNGSAWDAPSMHTDSGTRTSPATTTEAENPNPGSCTNSITAE